MNETTRNTAQDSATAPYSVTVVVSAYNAERFLGKCLSSLLVQTLESLEILAIDDGSTDGTSALIAEFARRDSRVVALHHSNRGLSATMNRGVREARGEYVTFFDADDYADPEMLQVMYAEAKRNSADVVVCGQEVVTEQGETIRRTTSRFAGSYDGYDYLQVVLRADNSLMFHDKIFRRSLFIDHQIEFAEGKFYEDMDAGIKVMLHANRVFVINRYFYKYVWHDQAITKTFSRKKIEDFGDSVLRTWALLQQEGMHQRHYIDFLQGALARTLNFIDQAADYPRVDDGKHITEHILALVTKLRDSDVLTRESLRLLSNKARKNWRKYVYLLDLIESPEDAIMTGYKSLRALEGSSKQKSGPEEKIARQVKKVRLRYFPVGSFQRRAFAQTLRLLMSSSRLMGGLSRTFAAKGEPEPERLVSQPIIAPRAGKCYFSIGGKSNLIYVGGEATSVISGTPPDLSAFRHALFFHVEDVSIAQQIDKWFEQGFLKRDSTLIINRFHQRGHARILGFLHERGYNFICVAGPDQLDFSYLDCIFYPFPDSLANIGFVEHRECTHISLGHGESDKRGSVDPIFRVYDHVFVSGLSAIDRFLNTGSLDAATVEQRVVAIGMPYLAPSSRAHFECDPAKALKRIAYLPTWEQTDQKQQYSSLTNGFGYEVLENALAVSEHEVYFKPHPITGRYDAQASQDVSALIETFAPNPRFVFVRDPLALGAAQWSEVLGRTRCRTVAKLPNLGEFDAVLTDVSSVIANAVHARVPCIALLPDETLAFIKDKSRWGQFTLLGRVPHLARSEICHLPERLHEATDLRSASMYESARVYVTEPTEPALRGKPPEQLLAALLELISLKESRQNMFRFGLDPAYKRLHRVQQLRHVGS